MLDGLSEKELRRMGLDKSAIQDLRAAKKREARDAERSGGAAPTAGLSAGHLSAAEAHGEWTADQAAMVPGPFKDKKLAVHAHVYNPETGKLDTTMRPDMAQKSKNQINAMAYKAKAKALTTIGRYTVGHQPGRRKGGMRRA